MKTHLDLFSGIGGFALAARWAGIETVQFVEIDPFCQKVLAKQFPGVPIHDDIKTFTYAECHRRNGEAVSIQFGESRQEGVVPSGCNKPRESNPHPFILTGGFPCQPFSCAGKRRGKEDDRAIWPEMLRVISESKPHYVLAENVAGFINMGLDDCISDLEGEGYEVQAFVIPACAKNAPHRRDRVWIVANRTRELLDGTGRTRKGRRHEYPNPPCGTDSDVADTDRFNGDNAGHDSGEVSQFQKAEVFGLQDVADTASIRSGTRGAECAGQERGTAPVVNGWSEPWLEAATRLCRVDDGLPRQVDRVNRLKALGNAIVPQIAFELMKAIMEVQDVSKELDGKDDYDS